MTRIVDLWRVSNAMLVGILDVRPAALARWALIPANAALEKAPASFRSCGRAGGGGMIYDVWGIYIALVLQHLVSRDSVSTQPCCFLNPCMMCMCMMNVGQGIRHIHMI